MACVVRWSWLPEVSERKGKGEAAGQRFLYENWTDVDGVFTADPGLIGGSCCQRNVYAWMTHF